MEEGFPFLPIWPPLKFPLCDNNNNNNFLLVLIAKGKILHSSIDFLITTPIKTLVGYHHSFWPLLNGVFAGATHFVVCRIWDYWVSGVLLCKSSLQCTDSLFCDILRDVTTFHDLRLGGIWRWINWTLFVGKDTATGHAIRNLTIFQHVQTERPSFYTTLCDYCDGVQVAFQSNDDLTALGVTSWSAPQSLPLFGWRFPERA